MLIPRTPPGYKEMANSLNDLNKMYGSSALKDPRTRAKIRRKYGEKIDIKEVDGEWQLVQVQRK